MPPPAAEGTPGAGVPPKRARSDDSSTHLTEQLKARYALLGAVHSELNSKKPLSGKAGGSLMSALVQMAQWPSKVSLLYTDASVTPEFAELTRSQSTPEDHDVYPLQIHHRADGSILAGLQQTPPDLQIKVEPSALSHVDAVVSALRLISDKASHEALQALLHNTGYAPHDIHRILDAKGHPSGAYRFQLECVKLNLANKLLLMGVHLAQQVDSLSNQT